MEQSTEFYKVTGNATEHTLRSKLLELPFLINKIDVKTNNLFVLSLDSNWSKPSIFSWWAGSYFDKIRSNKHTCFPFGYHRATVFAFRRFKSVCVFMKNRMYSAEYSVDSYPNSNDSNFRCSYEFEIHERIKIKEKPIVCLCIEQRVRQWDGSTFWQKWKEFIAFCVFFFNFDTPFR